MTYATEQAPRNVGDTYAPGAEERADAVLAKILGTTQPNTEAVAAPASEPEQPQSTPTPAVDETLTYAGFTPSMQAKLSPEERLALVTHHKAENAKAKAQAERLNQLEKATQAPAPQVAAPVTDGRAASFEKAAEPLVEILGLGQEHLPTVAAFAKTIADTVRSEFAGQLGPVAELHREAQQELVTSTMKVLGERFPQSNDAAVMATIRANVEAIRASPKYQTCAPTAKERAVQLWHDAAIISGLSPVAPVNEQQRDSARNAGQVSPSQKVVAPVGENPQQRIDRLALKAATTTTF